MDNNTDNKKNKTIDDSLAPPDTVIGFDLSFQNLKFVNSNLFLMSNLKELLLNNNDLISVPHGIYKIRNLEKLNLGCNRIKEIPADLGKAVPLKELYLNDNLISEVPFSLGSLYNLEVFNLSNNPLQPPFSTIGKDKLIIRFCRENNVHYPKPNDRSWIETAGKVDSTSDVISVGTYNILCNYYAAKLIYAPSWVINPDYRRDILLQTIISYDLDILSIQELETSSYCDYYRIQLGTKLDYDSLFFPKGRLTAFGENKNVHGVATFWKKSKFKLIDEVRIDFHSKIVSDTRFKMNQDILNRYGKKDNIVLVTVLERSPGQNIIVMNPHLFWDPEFSDIKLFQAILLLEELEKVRAKHKNSSVLLMGDFNSMPDSSVYKLIVERKVSGEDFEKYDYAPFNDGFRHTLRLTDAYENQDLNFTNYTPTFKGVIDYIFHSEGLIRSRIISPVEESYLKNTVGFPNIHFPSDHILIGAQFQLKGILKKVYKSLSK